MPIASRILTKKERRHGNHPPEADGVSWWISPRENVIRGSDGGSRHLAEVIRVGITRGRRWDLGRKAHRQ